MTNADRILELENRIAELEEELDDLNHPPPDWFAQPEPYEQMYARLHPHRAEQAGTQPAPWSW